MNGWKHDFYFVGNAHLDVVWIWSWQEGSCEAKATLRSALDRMKEYPEFCFVCSAACVFEWIEEFDPAMFEEIRQRVAEGRFRIVGGWYVQPDCNNPSGEGFARQGLYAQRYFAEKFGVTATVGYNVDSFGHCATRPQILRKQGMNAYVFHRPGIYEKKLPSHLFLWQSPDGSQVTATRILRGYNTSRKLDFATVEAAEKLMRTVDDEADAAHRPVPFFFGVGNHGGGPTKHNLDVIRKLREKYPGTKIVVSELTDFFEAAGREDLPVVQEELQYHAVGCYSAVSAVKNAIRRAECEAVECETFNALARALLGKPGASPKEIQAIWRNVLFAHFHDSMGGCCVKYVHEDMLRQLGESRSRAARVKNNALQSLSWQIDSQDASRGCPVVVFNPHPFAVAETVSLNGPFTEIRDESGTLVPTQIVHSPGSMARRAAGDTIFRARVPALGYVCYYRMIQRAPYLYEAPPGLPFPGGVTVDGFSMENEFLRVTVDPERGVVTSLYDKTARRELLRGFGGAGVVLDESEYDTWAHGVERFDQEIGAFKAVCAEVTENGPVRAAIKVTAQWGRSTMRQYFTLSSGSRFLEVRCRLDWHETCKMLKLRWETAIHRPQAFFEIPFGVVQRPADGREVPGQTWIAVRGQEGGVALVNDCKYSFSVQEGTVDVTAVRSPYYNDHARGNRRVPESDLTDQGDTEFFYALRAMTAGEGWGKLVQEAHSFNLPCTVILENNHTGALPHSGSFLTVSAENVALSAVKRREDNRGTVIRLYETDGKKTAVTVSGAVLPAPLETVLMPYSVETFTLPDGEQTWKKCLMTELD